ncbi:DUF7344 domain-containing protein [Halopelagius fulvigenes]|uniref:ArsR family transcriptional regulator n=1 Tax=Halopelagius fulvigenes TaxID=1198324 RepID=A0ABD5U480_9EURY
MTDSHFEALANGHRRQILASLMRENGRSVVPDAADDLSGERQLQAEIAFRHVHLPKLDAVDFIDWDPESGIVAKGPRFGDIEPLLRFLTNEYTECFEIRY